ncbi:hypothetical protein [Pedobacter sp. BAL39]|uniref:hypothetical protein n=1 Tax=Pedobacter sp. BAL39 TaxID=391596 RepID=UPI0002F0A729|nr:hypothetical protein [Pedobacter sp. BAL39]
MGSNSVFGELAKFPFLISHYLTHQKQDPAVTFLRFIDMHYLGNDIQDHDQQQDMKLPFKKINPHLHTLLFTNQEVTDHTLKAAPSPDFICRYSNEFTPSPYCGTIDRPPQLICC